MRRVGREIAEPHVLVFKGWTGGMEMEDKLPSSIYLFLNDQGSELEE